MAQRLIFKYISCLFKLHYRCCSQAFVADVRGIFTDCVNDSLISRDDREINHTHSHLDGTAIRIN